MVVVSKTPLWLLFTTDKISRYDVTSNTTREHSRHRAHKSQQSKFDG